MESEFHVIDAMYTRRFALDFSVLEVNDQLLLLGLDQLRLDGVEATLEAAEALVEGRAVAHVVCLNPRGPRRRAWAAQLAALDRGPWAARAALIRVAESRCDGVKSGLARLVAEFCRAARAPTGAAVEVVVAATRNKKLLAEIEGVTVAKRVVVFEPPRNTGSYPPRKQR